MNRPGLGVEGRYGRSFQASIDAGARSSARVVVPLVVDLLRPAGVVDVGCGSGAWLATFKAAGVRRVLGVDHPGDGVGRRLDASEFVAHDLTEPLPLDAGFDLAVSLEVAEHLPAAKADAFVGRLVGLAPAVLFSAAVPHQGGTGHVNEQWPEYWAGRFVEHGFVPVDCLRQAVWNHPDVEFWYAQNMLLYVHPDTLAANPALTRGAEATDAGALARVHPRLYLAKCDQPGAAVLARASRVSAAARAGLRRGRDALRPAR